MQEIDKVAYHSEPLLMIVEDNNEILTRRKKFLEKEGCIVIGFNHSDDAFKYLCTSPNVDLILTDIDLVGNSSKLDKTGVHFAKLVKEFDYDMPLCGYSALFSDDELTSEEKSYFDKWYAKAKYTIPEMKQINLNIKKLALDYKMSRYERNHDLLIRIGKELNISTEKEEYHILRELILKADDENEIEKILNEANFSLKIINPKDVCVKTVSPIIVWIREHNEESNTLFEIEVFGHSTLYSYGEDEEQAINSLIDIMMLYYEDLSESDDKQLSKQVQNLKEYLVKVFG